MSTDVVTCPSCGNSYKKEELKRSCGNCFACVSCEIYICYHCKEEIVVKPMKKRTYGNSTK